MGTRKQGTATGRMARRSTVDFDAEARKIFKTLGLDASGASSGAPVGFYNPLDPIFRDVASGGTIFVGNQQAAQNANMMKNHGVTHIVNCTDNMPFFHQNDRAFTYYRFNVSFWTQHGGSPEKLPVSPAHV